jgi:hypothetical protein
MRLMAMCKPEDNSSVPSVGNPAPVSKKNQGWGDHFALKCLVAIFARDWLRAADRFQFKHRRANICRPKTK